MTDKRAIIAGGSATSAIAIMQCTDVSTTVVIKWPEAESFVFCNGRAGR